MRTEKLKSKTLKIRESENEVTYSEAALFKQYFLQILYDFTIGSLEEVTQKVFTALDNNNKSEAVIILSNYVQSQKLQEVGRDAWMYCFAILIDKDKQELNAENLIELFKEYENELTKEIIETSVVNFLKAFPILWKEYQFKKERLTMIEELFFKRS